MPLFCRMFFFVPPWSTGKEGQGDAGGFFVPWTNDVQMDVSAERTQWLV